MTIVGHVLVVLGHSPPARGGGSAAGSTGSYEPRVGERGPHLEYSRCSSRHCSCSSGELPPSRPRAGDQLGSSTFRDLGSDGKRERYPSTVGPDLVKVLHGLLWQLDLLRLGERGAAPPLGWRGREPSATPIIRGGANAHGNPVNHETPWMITQSSRDRGCSSPE